MDERLVPKGEQQWRVPAFLAGPGPDGAVPATVAEEMWLNTKLSGPTAADLAPDFDLWGRTRQGVGVSFTFAAFILR